MSYCLPRYMDRIYAAECSEKEFPHEMSRRQRQVFQTHLVRSALPYFRRECCKKRGKWRYNPFSYQETSESEEGRKMTNAQFKRKEWIMK